MPSAGSAFAVEARFEVAPTESAPPASVTAPATWARVDWLTTTSANEPATESFASDAPAPLVAVAESVETWSPGVFVTPAPRP